MPVIWPFDERIDLRGKGRYRIAPEDAARQQETARSILKSLAEQPGIILADEVGMGKTFVALAIIASVLIETRGSGRPVVVMVPPGLASKWPRDWEHFKTHCCKYPKMLAWVRDEFARTPTDFFKLLDDPKRERAHLIWMTTRCFSTGLKDPWIKLALFRLAKARTKRDVTTRRRLYKWAADLTRMRSKRRLTPALVRRLMKSDLRKWHGILIREGLLKEGDDDPVPKSLLESQNKIDWRPLATALRDKTIPGSRGSVSDSTIAKARRRMNDALRDVYWQWMRTARWQSPLLVMDEAHHAKNDYTRLARLFRS